MHTCSQAHSEDSLLERIQYKALAQCNLRKRIVIFRPRIGKVLEAYRAIESI
jgi:hypothetical protein